MNSFEKLQKEIKPYSKFIDRYSKIIYQLLISDADFNDLPIEENIILEGIHNSLIFESDDPSYNIKFEKELEHFTKENLNSFVTKNQIVNFFPEVSQYNLPTVFIAWLDFSNKSECETFLKSISRLNENSLKTCNFAIRMKDARGMLIDLTKFKVNFVILLFNASRANSRTIYHEWTHYFQTFTDKDKFKMIIEKHQKSSVKKEKSLNEFGLSIDAVEQLFFSNKEYITRMDNLLYMLHQVQKLEKYKNMSDYEFSNKFIKTFSTENSNCLESELAKDIISIDPGFKIDILFFISLYICYKTEYRKLCLNLAEKL